ncbi:hypothetical protein GOQ27_11130 [Clostridium sp. D2Q-11]|uniref:Uncharacterized protein n=1 Tax=Anaeromonas frigoriresistens TaxID=2683708 RepID=A0A942Z7S3_9FIRM|nr:hypothetical protein [Anaeromonas frigoriresistens]MBS4539017.1 hypothetical protein [Anaeromonas frigoriresistens]
MTKKYKECPKCNPKNVAKIVYGYPSHELYKEPEEGQVILGGCCIMPDSPEYHCNECDAEWRKEDMI